MWIAFVLATPLLCLSSNVTFDGVAQLQAQTGHLMNPGIAYGELPPDGDAGASQGIRKDFMARSDKDWITDSVSLWVQQESALVSALIGINDAGTKGVAVSNEDGGAVLGITGALLVAWTNFRAPQKDFKGWSDLLYEKAKENAGGIVTLTANVLVKIACEAVTPIALGLSESTIVGTVVTSVADLITAFAQGQPWEKIVAETVMSGLQIAATLAFTAAMTAILVSCPAVPAVIILCVSTFFFGKLVLALKTKVRTYMSKWWVGRPPKPWYETFNFNKWRAAADDTENAAAAAADTVMWWSSFKFDGGGNMVPGADGDGVFPVKLVTNVVRREACCFGFIEEANDKHLVEINKEEGSFKKEISEYYLADPKKVEKALRVQIANQLARLVAEFQEMDPKELAEKHVNAIKRHVSMGELHTLNRAPSGLFE